MRVEIECLIIGSLSALCCMISYKIVYSSTKSKYSNTNLFQLMKCSKIRNNIIMCFIFGSLIHYIVKISNLSNMYCKKVCYDNQCFMVCPI